MLCSGKSLWNPSEFITICYIRFVSERNAIRERESESEDGRFGQMVLAAIVLQMRTLEQEMLNYLTSILEINSNFIKK